MKNIKNIKSIKNITKTFISLFVLTIMLCNIGITAFAAVKPMQDNAQQYKLVYTYTIKHKPSSKGKAYFVNADIKLGDVINSPYMQTIEEFKSSDSQVSNNGGRYVLTAPTTKTLNLNDTITIVAEETFSAGTIDYNINKENITDNFSELPNYQKYLQSNANIQTDNPLIQQKAKELTQNIDNPYDKAYEIFKYVNTNIDYVDSPAYANKGALSALTTHKGVCQDYAQLFVALCRASGIPARTVNGFRNTNSNADVVNLKGHEHMWAEFYMHGYGWVIAEPTMTLRRNGKQITADECFSKQINPAEHIARDYDVCSDEDIASNITLKYKGKPSCMPKLTADEDVKLYNLSKGAAPAENSAMKPLEPAKPVEVPTTALVPATPIEPAKPTENPIAPIAPTKPAVVKAEKQRIADPVIKPFKEPYSYRKLNTSEINLLKQRAEIQLKSLENLWTSYSDFSLQYKVGNVQNKINKLPETINEKAEYEARLFTLLAEINKTQTAANKAMQFVNVLPDGTLKTQLITRLQIVMPGTAAPTEEAPVEKTAAASLVPAKPIEIPTTPIKPAKPIEKPIAPIAPTKPVVAKPEKQRIADPVVKPFKEPYSYRKLSSIEINVLKQRAEIQLKSLEKLWKSYNDFSLKYKVSNVQNKINKLPETIKERPEYEARLFTLLAEINKTQTSIDKAMQFVNVLPNETLKTQLMTRLSVI